jgi:HlyD family secretion protein
MKAIARLAAMMLILALAACGSNDQTFQGWVEAELVFVGPDEAGRVETLSVREGDTVVVGSPLFAVDAELQQADLQVSEAARLNAQQAADRAKRLLSTSAGTQKSVDDAEAALRSAEARVNAAKTRLARRNVTSPAAGSIQQIYYRPGETVAAGRPIVALLPPSNVKVRFYVPQALLPKIALGDMVQIRCDGCGSEIMARVSFIARSSEFTPPVIYSLEERSKLVYLVEARPERPDSLRVGQPVSVVHPAAEPKR